MKRLPRSHDIIDQVHLPGEHYSMDTLTKSVKDSVIKIFIDYTERCKGMLLAYCIITLITISFDFVEFLIQYIRFGHEGAEHSELFMLALVVIFLTLDLFYVIWVAQAKDKFPADISY